LINTNETLKDIAEFYKVNEAELKMWNNLNDSTVLKAGDKLIIKLKQNEVGN
jgi:LysM repeat protein